MSDLLLGELLCLGLLIIICGRIFFIKREKIVHITILAPVALVLSFLLITAWGLTLMEAAIFLLTALVFLSNIHAMSRFMAHLYIDHYNPAFYIFSLFLFICSIAVTAVALYFRPVPVPPARFNVSVTKQAVTGSFSAGVKIKDKLSDKTRGILWTFKPGSNIAPKKTAIIFSADKRADTARYLPYLTLLANAGYTVLAADFYMPDGHWLSGKLDSPILRRAAMIYLSEKETERFKSMDKNFTENTVREYDSLISLGTDILGSGTPLFIIGDAMESDALGLIRQKYPYQVTGTYMLGNIKEYKTSGYGCIEQTSPLLAYLINGINRDASLFIPRYMVLQTQKAVAAAGGSK
jgi:hypothetical protein